MDIASAQPLVQSPLLNVLAPENLRDPYPFFRHLHDTAPIYFDEFSKAWVVAKYDFISLLLKDARLSVDRYDAIVLDLSDEHRGMNNYVRSCLSNFLLNVDDPKHARLRRLTKSVFQERAVSRMREYVQSIADELIENIYSSKKMDVVGDFAYPLPIRSVCKILGLLDYDLEEIKELSDNVSIYIGSAGRSSGCVPLAYYALIRLSEIFRPLVQKRRACQQKDLISDMVASGLDGDSLSDEEVIANCILFLVAGFETVTNLIACGTLALLQNKEELRKLIEDPVHINGVIDEALRFYPPVNRTARLCLEDIDIGNVTIKKGEIVILLLGAGNRDPHRFSNPDSFNITRKAQVKNLSFGAGAHHCIGHLLARLEGEIAIQTLFRRLPHIQLDEREIEWRGDSKFRGLKHLPITFNEF